MLTFNRDKTGIVEKFMNHSLKETASAVMQ